MFYIYGSGQPNIWCMDGHPLYIYIQCTYSFFGLDFTRIAVHTSLSPRQSHPKHCQKASHLIVSPFFQRGLIIRWTLGKTGLGGPFMGTASSECKILYVISKPLTFAVNVAFWGAVWGPECILHPLWQGKGASLNLHRSAFASGYKHFKCYITMQQCRIWGRGTGNAGK